MKRIEADYDTLMRQGPITALLYFDEIAEGLEQRGINPKAPAYASLVTALCEIAAKDYNNAVLCQTLQDAAMEIRDALCDLARATKDGGAGTTDTEI